MKIKFFFQFFFLNNLFTQKQKNRKNIEQCPIRYILDLNRENVKSKLIRLLSLTGEKEVGIFSKSFIRMARSEL